MVIFLSLLNYENKNYYEKIGNNETNITNKIPFDIPYNWKYAKILTFCTTISTNGHQISEQKVLDCGQTPVVSQSKSMIDGYTNETNKRIIVNEPIVLFGDHTRVVKYINFDFVVGADGTKLLQPILVDSRWFYYAILWTTFNIRDKGYGRHFDSMKKIVVPLPPKDEQTKIANSIDKLFNELN